MDSSEASVAAMEREVLHTGGYKEDRNAVLSETGKDQVRGEAELEKEWQRRQFRSILIKILI